MLEEQCLQTVCLLEEVKKLRGETQTESHPNQFFMKLTEDDDIETYLCMLELRTDSTPGRMAQDEVVRSAGPFLSRDAQKTI